MAIAAFFVAFCGHALAVTEYCPASVDELHPIDGKSSPGGPLGPQAGLVLINVAISASGAPDDSWVLDSSGIPKIDAAALAAARASSYSAGTSFCQPAPGVLIYRLEYQR